MELMSELLVKLAKVGLLASTLWVFTVICIFFMYSGSIQEEVDRIKGRYRSFSLITPLIILFLSTIILFIK